MKRSWVLLVSFLFIPLTMAQSTAEVSLTRLDCGTPDGPYDITHFSDTFAYDGKKVQLTYSCYLIQHGDQYLVWDAGKPLDSDMAPKTNLVDLLAILRLKPEQINYLAISHYHPDHTGQANLLPDSTLLIGKEDWDELTNDPDLRIADPTPFKPWIHDGSKVEPIPKDKDVFGDGSVVMLKTPGHTPGHHSLLVRLKGMGNVLISGDLAHFQENYDKERIPEVNPDRADTLASLDRFKEIAENLNATVVIQHEAADIDKLPAFPKAAR